MALTFQQTALTNLNTDNPTLTFGSNVTAGSFLIVAFHTNSANPVTGISDNAGNSYQNLILNNAKNSLWVVPSNLGSGVLTITINCIQATQYDTVWAAEYTGQAAINPLNAFSQFAMGGTAMQSPNIITSWTNETLIGVLWAYPSGPFTPGSGYTMRQVNNLAAFEDKNVSVPGTYRATATATGSSPSSFIAVLGVKSTSSTFVGGGGSLLLCSVGH